ncbi:TetR family transcriptional regulator [Jongsikchunia kroppenstedtii]|uniref:TetR family transcriptional regulator n=1 Tax=Jongsikchunia kroppenstedtii TaxID=1121721 RepID=UPI000364DF79|nr:TetR family transcriptional regulator [Jongsikchunia kroppenstedtii]
MKTLRDQKRLAVQREATARAVELFGEHGYDAVTVDQLAAAAGMSRRTFFRYFASKDELIVGKWELIGRDITEALCARPSNEPTWEALRRAFDVVVEHYADPVRRANSLRLDAIVLNHPTLRAAYLLKINDIARTCADIVRRRDGYAANDPLPYVIANAAGACLMSAMAATLADRPDEFADEIDALMARVRIG